MQELTQTVRTAESEAVAALSSYCTNRFMSPFSGSSGSGNRRRLQSFSASLGGSSPSAEDGSSAADGLSTELGGSSALGSVFRRGKRMIASSIAIANPSSGPLSGLLAHSGLTAAQDDSLRGSGRSEGGAQDNSTGLFAGLDEGGRSGSLAHDDNAAGVVGDGGAAAHSAVLSAEIDRFAALRVQQLEVCHHTHCPIWVVSILILLYPFASAVNFFCFCVCLVHVVSVFVLFCLVALFSFAFVGLRVVQLLSKIQAEVDSQKAQLIELVTNEMQV